MPDPIETISPTADDQVGLQLQRPSSTYQSGINIVLFVDELGQNRWRVDGRGAMGTQNIHVAPGTNMPAEEAATLTYGIHLDSALNIPLLLLDAPTTAESATWDQDFLKARDPSGDTKFRVNKDGRPVTKVNVGIPAGDLQPGELTLWLDQTPSLTQLKIVGKDSNGTVKRASITLT